MRAPSSSGFQNQLLQQYLTSNQQLTAQTSAFQASQDAANAAAAKSVADQTAQTTSSINAATQAPAQLSTIQTSARGLLGNPALSFTKLGG